MEQKLIIQGHTIFMRIKYMSRTKGGSITIETAIAFTVTLCFISSVLTAITLLRTDILMQRAVSNTCEDFALLTPLSVTAADSVSTLANALPDGTSSSQNIEEQLSSVITRLAGFDMASGNSLTEAAMDIAISSNFENQIADKYIEYNDGSDFLLPSYIDVDFDIDPNTAYITVYVSYEVDTLVGRVSMHITDGIPFYGDMELFLNGQGGSEESSSDEDVWSMDNISRGMWFEEHYGSNLPHTFPVINNFENGQATSYLSIDLNRPSYSDNSRIERRIGAQIEELAEFNGADVNINGNNYVINEEDITSRRLLVVVPSNSPNSALQTLSGLEAEAERYGVELVIVPYGES